MKKIFVLILLILCVSIIGPGAGKSVKIGVIHIRADHPDHILLRTSFIDALKKKGYNVNVTIFDANSVKYPETYTLRSAKEAERMEAAGIEMIYCTATYHGIVNTKIKIPVIDGVLIAPWLQKVAVRKGGKSYCIGNATGNVFGYSFKDITQLARDIMPNSKKIAYIFNPKSPISRPIKEIDMYAKRNGFTVIPCAFTTKEDITAAVKKAVENAEIAFITNDIAVVGGEKEVFKTAEASNFPVIVGIVPLVKAGAIAAIQYDWARAGEICADYADKIFKGTPANQIPITFADRIEVGINLKAAGKIGIKIPPDWLSSAKIVVK